MKENLKKKKTERREWSIVLYDRICKMNMQNVTTAMITKSIRNAFINNVDIKENDYIGFIDKTMLVSNKNKLDSYFELLNKLNIKDRNYLINIYGELSYTRHGST